jgi:hypothetical protein
LAFFIYSLLFLQVDLLVNTRLDSVSSKSPTILAVANPVSTGPGTVAHVKAVVPRPLKREDKSPVEEAPEAAGIPFSRTISHPRS